ncbi:unnamed protein product [Parnassius apollo]|uniref:(apollo) hypothetical protein n=1 Tax=Parnassius apollo TaxID=110799 RepID=A0A8S3W899_PARAO|nr:unnamed protein product [Parnassius apollo]
MQIIIITALQGCSRDDHISTSLNTSEVSSELNQDQIRATEGLEDLNTLSDLGLSHDDRNDMTTPLVNESLESALDREIPRPSFNLEQTEPADFDSDDSARDKTFNPRVEESSSSEDSLSSSENIGMYQENASNDVVLNTRRKRKGQNLRKTIQIKRNKGQSYETKSGKIIASRKVTALSDFRKKCRNKISLDNQTILFDELWALANYNKRSEYLSSLIFDTPKKNTRIRNTGGEPKPRTINHTYHLKVNGQLIEKVLLERYDIILKRVTLLRQENVIVFIDET